MKSGERWAGQGVRGAGWPSARSRSCSLALALRVAANREDGLESAGVLTRRAIRSGRLGSPMKANSMIDRRVAMPLVVVGLIAAGALAARGAEGPIVLSVDASQAARRVFTAHLTIPARPGPLALVYPKWIPGTHSPSNSINALVGLKFSAKGKPLAWSRDAEDLHAFRVEVPEGVEAVEADLSYLPSPEGGFRLTITSAKLAVINWGSMLLYPQGKAASEVSFRATVRLPAGWKHATALPPARTVEETPPGPLFEPVTLETLIDSPLLCGAHLRSVPLTEGAGDLPPHMLHLAGDTPEALQIHPKVLDGFKRLPVEARAMLGTPPYRQYHFLVSLSDEIPHGGLEHHESSDNRAGERALLEADKGGGSGELFAHELSHAWNGKFRRPGGLATPDYQKPYHTELIWVYEGLTSYLGYVLAARSGLVPPEVSRDRLAGTAAHMDHQPARGWRSLHDTSVSAPALFGSPHEWRYFRRGTDFYPEGLLIWLEIDTILRKQTEGKRSLDDFCLAFFGGSGGRPRVEPYELGDLIALLGQIAPYDWKGYFRARLHGTDVRAPLGGVAEAGWRVAYADKPTETARAREGRHGGGGGADLAFCGGLICRGDGTVGDVVPGSAADAAGLAPGMKIVSVDGRRFSTDGLKRAIGATKDQKRTIELQVDSAQFLKTVKLEYAGGLRYPRLERTEAVAPDRLAEILKAKATKPATGPTTAANARTGAAAP